MPDPEFRIAVRPAEGGTRIELAGELDVSTAAQFQRAADEIMTAAGDVWLDCSNLTFADSSGLDALTRAAKALRAQERRLVLTDVRPMVRRAMDVMQITDLFQVE
ncbi:MAG TPA: STAS domain-containing protein [Acidimicrobiia bacterium]|nr:STAS domain-containing protein [Acidimicrobiia bacterium]